MVLFAVCISPYDIDKLFFFFLFFFFITGKVKFNKKLTFMDGSEVHGY